MRQKSYVYSHSKHVRSFEICLRSGADEPQQCHTLSSVGLLHILARGISASYENEPNTPVEIQICVCQSQVTLHLLIHISAVGTLLHLTVQKGMKSKVLAFMSCPLWVGTTEYCRRHGLLFVAKDRFFRHAHLPERRC